MHMVGWSWSCYITLNLLVSSALVVLTGFTVDVENIVPMGILRLVTAEVMTTLGFVPVMIVVGLAVLTKAEVVWLVIILRFTTGVMVVTIAVVLIVLYCISVI